MDSEMNERHTILVDKYRKAAASNPNGYAYKGLRIHALPGLHEYTVQRLQEHVEAGASVLDLAAGSGAMTLRMVDAGYRVTASDYVFENFRLHDSSPFFMADLNCDFSTGRQHSFDAIVASEIIEHLENPRHFARQCFNLLKRGGSVILSTPNVDTSASIARFIRDGTFQWFGDPNYEQDGHITPLTQWQLRKCFQEAGFDFVWEGSFGSRNERLGGSPRMSLLSKLIDRLMTSDEKLRDQIYVAVMRVPGMPGDPAGGR